MRKKRKVKKLSYEDLKQRFKSLECSKCGRWVDNVDSHAVKVKCSRCTLIKCIDLGGWPEIKERKKSSKPRGWHLMQVYVDKDKNVFHKGIEQPNLKGTLEETVIKPRKKKTKAERIAIKREKERIKEQTYLKIAKAKKKALKAEKNKIILKITKNGSRYTATDQHGKDWSKELKSSAKSRAYREDKALLKTISPKTNKVRWKKVAMLEFSNTKNRILKKNK